MSKTGLYSLNLSFSPEKGTVGAGSMTLALTVNASTGELHGQVKGTIHEGTQHPETFTAKVSGVMHSTGYGTIVKVGSVLGEAGVTVSSPAIGTYLAPCSASFSLDSDWNGQGQFSVGTTLYKSVVSLLVE